MTLLGLLASLLFAHAEDAPPPPPPPPLPPVPSNVGLPPTAGEELRLLMREAGFGVVAGERAAPETLAPLSAITPHLPSDPSSPMPPAGGAPVAGVHTVVPPPEGAPPPRTHQEMPPEKHGNAPGFILRVQGGAPLSGTAAAPVVMVGREQFVLHDDGQAPDQQAGDGTWAGMIERYPAGEPLVLLTASGAEVQRADIVLQPVQGIPVMELRLP